MNEPTLLPDQVAEGYSIEVGDGGILVWHGNTQIALLLNRDGVEDKAREIVNRRRKELQEVAEKTGWTPSLPPTG